MSVFERGGIWWYEFWFAGRRIRETTKTASKTLARNAEQKRRRELEGGYNNFVDTRKERVRTMSDIADEFYEEYKLRIPQSARFARYAIRHIKRLLGDKMLVDINALAVGNAEEHRSELPKIRRFLRGTTHKSPHNRSFWRIVRVGGLYGEQRSA